MRLDFRKSPDTQWAYNSPIFPHGSRFNDSTLKSEPSENTAFRDRARKTNETMVALTVGSVSSAGEHQSRESTPLLADCLVFVSTCRCPPSSRNNCVPGRGVAVVCSVQTDKSITAAFVVVASQQHSPPHSALCLGPETQQNVAFS